MDWKNLDFTQIVMIIAAAAMIFPKLKPLAAILAKFVTTTPSPVPGPAPDPAVPTPAPSPATPPNTLDSILALVKLFIEKRDNKGKEAALVALESYQASVQESAPSAVK